MARDDYSSYGNRGQYRGSEGRGDREWQQGGDWQRQQGGQGWYSQGGGGYGGPGGYGQGWSGPSGFGQGGYTRGGGGYGPGGAGQPWSGSRSGQEDVGMYGQGAYGQGGYGGGPESWGGQGQSMGRDYSRRDFGMETARDLGRGGYGPTSGFSGQQGYGQQAFGRQGFGQQGFGQQGFGFGQRMQRGQFAGRGPRGYRRSDDRIREDVNEELTRHPEIDASDVEVLVEDCEVTLVGVVEDRRDKRLAEDIAERVPGVNEVHNQLRPRKGIGEKIAEMLTGRSDREGDRDREAGEARSRTGRSTSTATS